MLSKAIVSTHLMSHDGCWLEIQTRNSCCSSRSVCHTEMRYPWPEESRGKYSMFPRSKWTLSSMFRFSLVRSGYCMRLCSSSESYELVLRSPFDSTLLWSVAFSFLDSSSSWGSSSSSKTDLVGVLVQISGEAWSAVLWIILIRAPLCKILVVTSFGCHRSPERKIRHCRWSSPHSPSAPIAAMNSALVKLCSVLQTIWIGFCSKWFSLYSTRVKLSSAALMSGNSKM